MDKACLDGKINALHEYLREMRKGCTSPEEAAVRVFKKGEFLTTSRAFWHLVHELFTDVLPKCKWGKEVVYDFTPGDSVFIKDEADFREKFLDPLLGKAFEVSSYLAEYGTSPQKGAEALQQLNHGQIRAQQLAQSVRPIAVHGTNQHSEKTGVRYNELHHGGTDTASYKAARIARDRPDIQERMARGEYSSVRAAAIDAGILKPRVQVTWKADASPEEIAAAIRRKVGEDVWEEMKKI